MKITLTGVQPGEWVKLNPGTVDFYRIMYTSEMLQQISPSIRDLTLPVADRVGILSDVYTVCRAGKQPLIQVLVINLSLILFT